MNIYVGNLSLEMTEDELREEFTKYGEVLSVTIMNDKSIGSGQSRGYGYIQMVSKEQGATAIANIEGKILKDHAVKVVEALPLTKYARKIPAPYGKKRAQRIDSVSNTPAPGV